MSVLKSMTKRIGRLAAAVGASAVLAGGMGLSHAGAIGERRLS